MYISVIIFIDNPEMTRIDLNINNDEHDFTSLSIPAMCDQIAQKYQNIWPTH